jgi:Adenylate kinase and related kinases
MIQIFLGPPYSGKGTQATILGKELNLPVFSMGELIREGNRLGNPKAVEGYQNYTLKGLHLPNSLKFFLLKEKMDANKNGFILDNYPATQEDLETLQNYLTENNLQVDKVFYVNISIEEMKNRMVQRGRDDDKPEIVLVRRDVQDKDRLPVLQYFREKGILTEINGEGTIAAVQAVIKGELNDKN